MIRVKHYRNVGESNQRQKFHVIRPKDGWILQKIGDQLAEIPGVSASESPNQVAPLNYFVNYALFEETKGASAAWFTHYDPQNVSLQSLWWEVFEAVDVAIFQAEMYRQRSLERFQRENTFVISPGVELHSFTPRRIRVGVVGRAYKDGRKGEDVLSACVRQLPEIEFVVTGKGWGVPSKRLKDGEMPALFKSIDYLFIPSRFEGGPMSAIEALASGVPVISDEIGWMPEIPHITLPSGNIDEALRFFRELAAERLSLRHSIADRTWDNFRTKHLRAFDAYLSH